MCKTNWDHQSIKMCAEGDTFNSSPLEEDEQGIRYKLFRRTSG